MASGALKSAVVASVDSVAPGHAAGSPFYSTYVASGLISNRLKLATEAGPQVSRQRRWIFAVLGGALFGIGAQFARGCTSGAALSGMAVLSTAGFVTMMAIFGTGYAGAWFTRSLWLAKMGGK